MTHGKSTPARQANHEIDSYRGALWVAQRGSNLTDIGEETSNQILITSYTLRNIAEPSCPYAS